MDITAGKPPSNEDVKTSLALLLCKV